MAGLFPAIPIIGHCASSHLTLPRLRGRVALGARDTPGDDATSFASLTPDCFRSGAIRSDIVRKVRTWIGSSSWSSSRSRTSTGRRPSTPSNWASTPITTTRSATKCGSCSSRRLARAARSPLARDSPIRPGSLKGVQLVVDDIEVAHNQLRDRGVAVSEVQDFPWGRFVFFNDPDGNAWSVQQIPRRP